jgi:hypothetical protein
MDNKLFKQRLTEVAEWRIPKIKPTASERRARAGRPSKEEQYLELHEEAFIEMFAGENPTQALELVKVKRCAEDCEDCGRHCEQGRDLENRKFSKSEREDIESFSAKLDALKQALYLLRSKD